MTPGHLALSPGGGSCQFCPAGWLSHAGRCYYFSSAKRSWEQSKEDCCSRGAQLAIIQANSTLVSTWVLAAPTSPWSLDDISVPLVVFQCCLCPCA
uniref:C-type lectin domain-containing protein n=1 Tax=Phasianus colchicus TaxID=9054 RepID=A0A669QVD8_PHACC